MANLITEAGANRVLTMDLHAAQIQGFFDIPVDNLYAAPLFSRDIQERYNGRDLMIVSPDVGGVLRARALATRLNCDLAIIDKRRERAGHSEVMNVIGDVEGRDCILVDDLVDSGGTHCNAAEALIQSGARSTSAYVTHGVLSGGAVARIASSPIETMVITDSILATEAVRLAPERPADHHRAADRGGDAADQRREFGEFAVRLRLVTRSTGMPPAIRAGWSRSRKSSLFVSSSLHSPTWPLQGCRELSRKRKRTRNQRWILAVPV